MIRRPVLLVLLGSPPDAVAAAHGPFPTWFDQLWGQHADQIDLQLFDGTTGRRPPDPTGFAGVILSGSPASMTEPEPWMEIAVELTRLAASIGTPVLGVCFGHQLIGASYGGYVVRNPAGWEIGTHRIALTDAGRADPLFEGLDDEFEVNLSHTDIVRDDTLAPANGVRVLAGNPRTAVQALAAGDSIRGIQFHPEFSGAITRSYIAARREDLAADAEARNAPHDHPDRLAAEVRDAPAAARVFANFTKHWILKA